MEEECLSEEISMAKISQEQYEEYRRALKRMRMLDDTLMKCVFRITNPLLSRC